MSDVRGVLLFTAEARVLNMSMTGAAIETNHYLKVGEMLRFKTNQSGKELSMTGKVIWCRLVSTRDNGRGDSEPVYSAGVNFADVFTAKAKALLDMIRGTHRVTVETRVTGRFRLELSDPVKLDREHQFSVRQISATGMLIETSLSPALDSVFGMRVNLGAIFMAQGRIVHLQEFSTPGQPTHHLLGIEFVDLPAEHQATLQRYIGGLDQRLDEPTLG